MKYRKLLIGATTIVSASGVGSAVAVPLTTSNHQSSTVTTPDAPVNPPVDPDTSVNPPVDPTPPEVIASIPTSAIDTFHLPYQIIFLMLLL